jgi:hypothetical protein
MAYLPEIGPEPMIRREKALRQGLAVSRLSPGKTRPF